jgi:hypothetical protein
VVAGPKLFGDTGSADHLPPFQYEDTPAGASDVGRRDEAVMTAADDHEIVSLHAF